MSIQSLFKSAVFFSIAFLFATPAFGAQSGSGNTTLNGCTINTAYISQGNLYIRFSANNLCGSIEVFDSLGNTHLAWSAVNTYSGSPSLYSAASMENGVIFIPTPYLEAGNPVTFTIRAHNPSGAWSDYSEAVVTYDGGLTTGCILKTFSYTVSGPGVPDNVVYDYTHSAYGGWICIPVFNGVQNLNSPITTNFQGGVNTMAVWAVPPGIGVGGTGSFVSDAVVFNYPGGSGGGGGTIPTTIEVDIVGLPNPNSASWSMAPGAYSGSGNATVDVSSSVGSGRTYTISPAGTASGCSLLNVLNSDGGGSSMTVYPGATQGFTVYYSCVNNPTVDIKADNSDGPIFLTPSQASNLTWTSTNSTSCSASGSWSGSKALTGSESTGALTTGSYSYVITCNNGAAYVSDSVEINVSGTPPPAPTITVSTSSTCASVDISWSGYNTALSTGFKLYRNGVLVATLGNQTSYTDSGLSAGSYTYTVKAFNGVGDSTSSNSSSATASAQCVNPVPVVTLTANPTSTSDGDTTLSWSATNNPTSCTASNNKSISTWNGSKSPTGVSQLITSITSTTIFSLYCTNGSGPSATVNVTVTYVPKVQKPVVTLSASPNPTNEGLSSILTWTASNSPTSCTAAGGNAQWTGSITPTAGGTRTITNITSAGANTFTLYCNNASGKSNTASVTIGVTSDPINLSVNLTANPMSVTSGGNTVLTWDPVLNATNCTANTFSPINPQWSGQSKSVAGGSQTITNLTQTTTFTLACSGNGGVMGQNSKTVTVSSGTATLNVTSNNASGSWSISPGGIVGTGTSGSSTVTPNSGGTVYTISPNSIPNYSAAVSSTRNGVSGGGSAVTVFPGDTVTYAITYSSSGPTFDYLLSNPGTLTITKGSSPVTGQKNAGKTTTQGTAQQVDTDLTGLPSGVSVTYANRSCSPNPTCTTGMTFTVDPSASVGTYPLVLKGTTSGLADKTQNFNLVIANSSPLDVNVSSNPSSTAQVGQQVTWTCTPSGGSGVYTYTWSGTGVPSPAPTASSFTTTYSTVGAKTVICTVNDGTQSVGSLERAVQVSVNPIFIEF